MKSSGVVLDYLLIGSIVGGLVGLAGAGSIKYVMLPGLFFEWPLILLPVFVCGGLGEIVNLRSGVRNIREAYIGGVIGMAIFVISALGVYLWGFWVIFTTPC